MCSSFSLTYLKFFYISISTLLFCCPVFFSFLFYFINFLKNHFYWFVQFPFFILQLALKNPALDASHQTTNKTVTQNYPAAHRLLKVTVSSQTPQNTPPEQIPAHQREKTKLHPPERREHYLLSGSLCKPLDQLHHQGQRTEARGTSTLEPRERKPQLL